MSDQARNTFLERLRESRELELPVSVCLAGGGILNGRVSSFDNDVLTLDLGNGRLWTVLIDSIIAFGR